MHAIVDIYMAGNPDAMDEVKKATFAFHFHFQDHPKAHRFTGSQNGARCTWCFRSRNQVRWDGQPPGCAMRPAWADETIESVIAREEKLIDHVLARARALALKIDVDALTGGELARLHHTHGIDPSMLEMALMEVGRTLPQHLHDDYEVAYEEHCETGKRGEQKPLIVAKTL